MRCCVRPDKREDQSSRQAAAARMTTARAVTMTEPLPRSTSASGSSAASPSPASCTDALVHLAAPTVRCLLQIATSGFNLSHELGFRDRWEVITTAHLYPIRSSSGGSRSRQPCPVKSRNRSDTCLSISAISETNVHGARGVSPAWHWFSPCCMRRDQDQRKGCREDAASTFPRRFG